jgi:hypothetical protein
MASIKIKASFAGAPVSPSINVEDEGALIVSTQDLNFVGAGVTVTENPLGTAEIDIPGTTIDIEDEGVAIITNPGAINFTGAGVTVTENPLGTAEIDIPGNPLTVKDEGVSIISNPANMNFIGAGVTVTENPLGTAEIDIPGNPLTVKDEGTNIISNPANMNFIGAGVTVTEDPAGTAKISIPGMVGGIAIGDAVSGAASGDMLFVNSAIQLAKNSLLQFDTANTRMSIGVAVGGAAKLNIKGSGATSATFSQIMTNSSNIQIFSVRDDGTTFAGPGGALSASVRFQVKDQSDQVCLAVSQSDCVFGDSAVLRSMNGLLQPSGNIIFRNGNPNSATIDFGGSEVNTAAFSGDFNFIRFTRNWTAFIPSVNPGVNILKSENVINLTNGTGTKIVRGFYHNPTVTGATSHRAFESSSGGGHFNTTSVNASAVLQADSTTQGFLPPRMTTAEKVSIATPAAGLVVYDTTLNKLCVFTTAWETITSV